MAGMTRQVVHVLVCQCSSLVHQDNEGEDQIYTHTEYGIIVSYVELVCTRVYNYHCIVACPEMARVHSYSTQ